MSGSLLDTLAHPPAVNLLEAYGGAAKTANEIWRTRQQQANQLAGQAFQDATGPDGTLSAPALNNNLRNAGPGAALAAVQTSQAGVTNATDAFNLHNQRLKGMNAAAMALSAQYPNGVPQQAVNAEIDRVGPIYGLSSQDIAQAKASFGADPVANTRTIIRNGISNLTAQEALHASRPSPITTDTGQVIAGGSTAPLAADVPGVLNVPGVQAGPGGQGVQLQTGPGANAALVHVVDPATGAGYDVPRSSLPGNTGVTGQPSPLGTGRPPAGSPLLNPTAAPPSGGAATPPAAPPQSAPAGGTMTSLPLGQPENIAADVGKFKQDQFAIPQGQQNVQSLQKAQLALEASNTGRNSQGVQNMLATIQSLSIPLPAGLSADVKNYDLAHKLLTDYARKSGAAAHSDLQLQTAEGANASTGISNQAALDVVHMNIGRERQAIAQNMEAPQTGIGYGSHSSQFSNSTDPRGFAIDAYKPAELQKMIAGMKEAEQAKFYKSVGIAQRLKLLNAASGQ